MGAGAFTLARWFGEQKEADEFQREELLFDLEGFTHTGPIPGFLRLVARRVDEEKGEQIIVRTARQTCMIEQKDVQGSPLVTFDCVQNDRWGRVGFWYNAHSVADLLDRLRLEAKGEAEFEVLFLGVKPE